VLQSMLFLHWKQIRVALIPFVIAAFGLPLLSIQGLGSPGGGARSLSAYALMNMSEIWLPLFPLLAVAIGVTLALSSWNWDHQLNHVYALSLPLPRWKYAMLKMGAGATLAAVPAAGFWLGAHLATLSLTLPTGLHAYPNALAVRFLVAILLSYATLFALAAGSVKTTVILFSSIGVFLILGVSLNGALADVFTYFQDTNVVTAAVKILADPHGPFEVFSGPWTLIDV